MYRFFSLLVLLSVLLSCKQDGSTSSQGASLGSKSDAEAFYNEMETLVFKYPHRSVMFRDQCNNSDDILAYYHEKGDKLNIPVMYFEYLQIFLTDSKPENTYYLSQWRGFRSKEANRLYPKYKFVDEGKWGQTVRIWNQLKENKYIIVCTPQKRMGPELLGGEKYRRGTYKGHFSIYNLQDMKVECYGEFSTLNKFNTPEQLKALSLDLRESLWIDLGMMFDLKLREAIEKASGIPAKNIQLNLETI